MRARLFSVILSGFLLVSGHSALADNAKAASKGSVKTSDKSASKSSPIVTDKTPKKDSIEKATKPGEANPPVKDAPIVTDPAPSKDSDSKSSDAEGQPKDAAPKVKSAAPPSPDAASIPSSDSSAAAATKDSSPAPSAEGAPATEAEVPHVPTNAAGTPISEIQAMEPHKRPVPDGYATAAELFKQRKFAMAEKCFEKIIQGGTADVNTHLCLAHCFLQQKIYSKAIKEFDWLSKYAKNSMSLEKSCEATARSLRYAMTGLCPAPCLKPNDQRWTVKNGAKVLLLPRQGGGIDTISEDNLGHLIVNEHGYPVIKGVCPVCEGTCQVPVLKDGGPMPRI